MEILRPQHLILFILFMFHVNHYLFVDGMENPFELLFDKCPKEESIVPCKCRSMSHEIICGGGDISSSNTLRYIFRDASPNEHQDDDNVRNVVVKNNHNSQGPIETKRNYYHYSHLILQDTPIETIANGTFEYFTFLVITIRQHYYLTKIELNAFVPSNSVTTLLKFDSNHKLGSDGESIESLFNVIRTFTNLETLLIHRCALTHIPANAFGGLQVSLRKLRRISLIGNRIQTIHSHAFVGHLPSLRLLILNNNELDTIEPNAIKLDTDHCTPNFNYEKIYYFIDLSNNRLQSHSIADSNSILTNCSTELNLSNNSIHYLPESIYRPMFSKFMKLFLYGNDLDCSHCEMGWMLRGRYCSMFNSTLTYQSLIESSNCNQTILSFETFREKCSSNKMVSSEKNPMEPMVESNHDLLHCPMDTNQTNHSSTTTKFISDSYFIYLFLLFFFHLFTFF